VGSQIMWRGVGANRIIFLDFGEDMLRRITSHTLELFGVVAIPIKYNPILHSTKGDSIFPTN